METLLAVATASSLAANAWYQLGVVIVRIGGQDRVTLYAGVAVRLRRTVLLAAAGAVHQRGYDRAGAGRSAGAEPILLFQ